MQRRMREQCGREPDLAELAILFGVSEAWLQGLLHCATEPWSLDDQGPGELEASRETIPDPKADDPAEMAVAASEREVLASLLAALSSRDREVLEDRFGLHGEPVSTADVALRLQISPAGVRQLQRRALRRLRQVWVQQAGLEG
jgi:RNA polymerase nonessential primary-like sigma factor